MNGRREDQTPDILRTILFKASRLIIAGLLCTFELLAYSQVGQRTYSLPGWNLPVTIAALKDVELGATERGVEKPAARPFNVLPGPPVLEVAKGETFQMIEIHEEGACLIRFRDKEYDLGSCPWLPGFTNHEEDRFKVLDKVPPYR